MRSDNQAGVLVTMVRFYSRLRGAQGYDQCDYELHKASYWRSLDDAVIVPISPGSGSAVRWRTVVVRTPCKHGNVVQIEPLKWTLVQSTDALYWEPQLKSKLFDRIYDICDYISWSICRVLGVIR